MNARATPAEHADRAAEAVRALNHATLRAGDAEGYEWPSDVDAVISQLQTMAQRLPQAITQASRWLAREHAAGRVGLDNIAHVTPLDFAVTAAVTELDDAAHRARQLADDLDTARAFTARFTGVRP